MDSLETDFERIANKHHARRDKSAETSFASWLGPHFVDLGSAELSQRSAKSSPAKFNGEAAIDRSHRRRGDVPRCECGHDKVLGKRCFDFSVDHDAL